MGLIISGGAAEKISVSATGSGVPLNLLGTTSANTGGKTDISLSMINSTYPVTINPNSGELVLNGTSGYFKALPSNTTTNAIMRSGAGFSFVNSGSGDVYLATLSSIGDLVVTRNVTAYSDIRIKTNIEKIPDALDKVIRLNGYTFDRTDVEAPRQTGVIAQEVLDVLPEAVTQNEESGHYSVAYGNMVGLLIEAIKELKNEIDVLKADK
jgi:hypothetical protein